MDKLLGALLYISIATLGGMIGYLKGWFDGMEKEKELQKRRNELKEELAKLVIKERTGNIYDQFHN